MPIKSWSTTDANNDNADTASNINWPEGMAPSQVNNSARAVMSQVKAMWDDKGYGGSMFITAANVAGTADAVTLTTSDGFASLAAGVRVVFVAEANNTGAVTVNLDSLGATALKQYGAALPANAILSGDTCVIVYDGTDFELLNPVRTPYLAANSVLSQGASAGRAAETTISEQQVVGRLTGESIKGISISELKSLLGISETYTSSEQTVSTDTTITLPHSLSGIPTNILIKMRCKTTDLGYAADEEVLWGGTSDFQAGDNGITVSADATNIYIVQGAGFQIHSKSTFNHANITTSSWRWVAYAEYRS